MTDTQRITPPVAASQPPKSQKSTPDIVGLRALNHWAELNGHSPHWVLCDGEKKALRKGWNRTSATFKQVEAHAGVGGLVGIKPESLGVVVLDIDKGGWTAIDELEARIGKPLHTAPSRARGRFHVFFRFDYPSGGQVRNRQWSLDGLTLQGEIRGSMGYVILWHDCAGGLADALAGAGGWITLDQLNSLPKPSKPRALAAPGGRHDDLNTRAFVAGQHGDESGEEEVKAAMEDARASGMPEARVQDEGGRAALDGKRLAKPKLRKDRDGLLAALAALKIKLRYNERAASIEVNFGKVWRALDEMMTEDIKWRIEQAFCGVGTNTDRPPAPLHFGGERWTECLLALLHERRVDPFKEWLETLPVWDGAPRLSGSIEAVFEVDSNHEGGAALAQWASRFLCLGAIWRTYRPGVKLDEMPILASPQEGIGKSTFLEFLFPEVDREQWFSSDFSWMNPQKARMESLLGAVILEAAEMKGITKQELAEIRSFLSRTVDKARLAYRRDPKPLPRRCILVGTGNADVVPSDPVGYRRFVVIPLKTGDPLKVRHYLNATREQLWAEALSMYHQGVEAWLPRDLKVYADLMARAHRRRDPLVEDAILEGGFKAGESYPLIEVFNTLRAGEFEFPQQQIHRITTALRLLNWEQRHGRSGNRWCPPANWHDFSRLPYEQKM